MNEEVCYMAATQLADAIRSKALSPREVMQAHLARTEAINSEINAIVTLADDALDQARKAEEALMKGEVHGPLHGVPFTAKDCFDTHKLRTTRGSQIFADYLPEKDAVAVRRLKQAGGILLGKTNLPEFALRGETANRVFGPTRNPWNRDRTSGGSSGGECAAIAAGLSPLGIGTDMGGSNRLPAHYCGVVGLKPTHGRIPLTGSWPDLMCRHMHVGPIARSVVDTALALSILSGSDDHDPYAIRLRDFDLEELSGELTGLAVGFLTEAPFAPVEAEIQTTVTRAAQTLERLGCRVTPVSFPWQDRQPITLCMDMLAAEAPQYLQTYTTGHEDILTPATISLLELPIPSLAQYLEALAKRESLAQDMTQFFAEHDILLCPTAPVCAPCHETAVLSIGEQEVDAGQAANITATFGLTGHPALSVPFGLSPAGLPIGVQLVTQPCSEGTLLRVAKALEQNGTPKRPPI